MCLHERSEENRLLPLYSCVVITDLRSNGLAVVPISAETNHGDTMTAAPGLECAWKHETIVFVIQYLLVQ